MYCEKCGAKISENTKFCEECSALVEPQLQGHTEREGYKKWIIATTSGVMVLAVAAAGIWIAVGGSEKNVPEAKEAGLYDSTEKMIKT